MPSVTSGTYSPGPGMARPPFAIALLSSTYGCADPIRITRGAKLSDSRRFLATPLFRCRGVTAQARGRPVRRGRRLVVRVEAAERRAGVPGRSSRGGGGGRRTDGRARRARPCCASRWLRRPAAARSRSYTLSQGRWPARPRAGRTSETASFQPLVQGGGVPACVAQLLLVELQHPRLDLPARRCEVAAQGLLTLGDAGFDPPQVVVVATLKVGDRVGAAAEPQVGRADAV